MWNRKDLGWYEMRPHGMPAAINGAIGGALGTTTMSALMLAARRAGLTGRLPPEHITEAALESTGADRDVGPGEKTAATVLAHYAFGMGAGIVFAWLYPRTPREIPAPLKGALFGTLVWTASYMGWVPALGILPRATRDRPGRPIVMLAAHWVFGATLGAFVHRV